MSGFIEVPFEVEKPQDGLRVDQYLSQRLHKYSRAQVQQVIAAGQVLLRGRVAKASSRVAAGEVVVVRYPKTVEAPPLHSSLPVLHEDQDLLAVNKPGDLLSHPTDKVVENSATAILKKQFPSAPLYLIHRLDRETSGVLMFAKRREAARAMSTLLASRKVRKTYLAIVRGRVAWKSLRADAALGREGLGIHVRMKAGAGQPAVTELRRVAASKELSVVEARPLTGRLHQIRVHLAHAGHPVLGDKLYTGDGELYMKAVRRELTDDDFAQLGAKRQMLHAASVEFDRPGSGELVRIEAGVPGDFEAALSRAAGGDAGRR